MTFTTGEKVSALLGTVGGTIYHLATEVTVEPLNATLFAIMGLALLWMTKRMYSR